VGTVGRRDRDHTGMVAGVSAPTACPLVSAVGL